MELWLDTCNLSLINEAKSLNLLHGITTNPNVLSISTHDPMHTLLTLLSIQQGPVTAQVTALSAQEMILQGRLLHAISPRLIIKIPTSLEGLKAIAKLSNENIPVMATVIYDRLQAINAIKAGASYVAIYIGRMEQAGLEAQNTLLQIVTFIERHHLKAKVMGASIRSKEHINWCLDARCHAITLGEQAFRLWTEENPLTTQDTLAFSKMLPSTWLVDHLSISLA